MIYNLNCTTAEMVWNHFTVTWRVFPQTQTPTTTTLEDPATLYRSLENNHETVASTTSVRKLKTCIQRSQSLSINHHQYIKIFVVCVSVCDGCGRGSNEFAGRVQNYCVPCAKLSRAFQLSQKSSRDVKAAAGTGQDTQSCRLREGCHCGRLPSH